MKKPSKTMRISALTAVSALALFGGAFGSAAIAADTPTPSPTATATPTSNPLDAAVNDQSAAKAILGNNQSTLNVLTSEVEAAEADEAAEAPEDAEAVEAAEVEEVDNEVEAIDTENQQESDSFEQDVADAVQAGDSQDAEALRQDAAIVTTVNAPEAQDMSTDNSEAHAIIVGTTK